MKVLESHAIPYALKFYSTESNFPLGVAGTRVLIENNQPYTEIGWLMVSKTAPPGSGTEILKNIEQTADRKSTRLVIKVHEDNDSLRRLVLDCQFHQNEKNEERFEKKLIRP